MLINRPTKHIPVITAGITVLAFISLYIAWRVVPFSAMRTPEFTLALIYPVTLLRFGLVCVVVRCHVLVDVFFVVLLRTFRGASLLEWESCFKFCTADITGLSHLTP